MFKSLQCLILCLKCSNCCCVIKVAKCCVVKVCKMLCVLIVADFLCLCLSPSLFELNVYESTFMQVFYLLLMPARFL